MKRTTKERLRYRDPRPVPYGYCSICGMDTLSTNANPFPKHDGAAHEVWAFDKFGMKAVIFPARPYVEEWAAGNLPTVEEFNAIRESARKDDND